MPEVVSLIDWLQRNIPAEDVAPPAPAICHGDYRLDNLVFDGQLKVSGLIVSQMWVSHHALGVYNCCHSSYLCFHDSYAPTIDYTLSHACMPQEQ